MKCKKCGFEIKSEWKYCPNCSKRIYKEQYFIIIVAIFLAIFLHIILPILLTNVPMSNRKIKNILENKYNEEFEISKIKSVKNQDTTLDCDGTSFGTIKGRGSKKYYKVYSKKNNIEFVATYDTSDIDKEIDDNYQDKLKMKNTLIESYEIINKYLNNKFSKIFFINSDKGLNITNKKQLEDFFSKYQENEVKIKGYEIFISEDLFDFCKSNYETIKAIHDDILKIQNHNRVYFDVTIRLNEHNKVELYDKFYEVYVYDYSTSDYMIEKLDEFVKRESY